MRGVFLQTGGQISVQDIPVPKCPENGVLVRTAFSLISSGTERSGITDPSGTVAGEVRDLGGLVQKLQRKVSEEGLLGTVQAIGSRLTTEGPISPLGYSAAGTVVQCGSQVTDLTLGEGVCCAGEYAHHQELLAVPRLLAARVPSGLDLRCAAFGTLGAIALHGVRQAKVQLGETVAVIGLGLVGQLTSQILKAAGCRVIGSDLDAERVAQAQRLGLNRGVASEKENMVDAVGELTGGHGVDATVLCVATESSDPVRIAMEITRRRGRVVVVGVVGMAIDRSPFYEKEIEFTISCSYGPGRYDPLYEVGGLDYPFGFVRWTENRNMEEFLRLLAEGKVDVAPLIQGQFSLDEAPKAYAELSQNGSRPIAVLLSYPESSASEAESRKLWLRPQAKKKEGLNVAVVGAGGFAQREHLPNLAKIKDVTLRGVVTQRGETASESAKRFGAEYCTTDAEEVFADSEVDVVVIATRHDLHAPLATAAAKAGKDIFLEKPMGITRRECRELAEAVSEAGVHFTVGFNRRFAPAIAHVRKEFGALSGPWQIVYRINAEQIPPDHWTQDPLVGGGRVIGEGCHFVDLCSFLIQDQVSEVFARALPVGGARSGVLDSYTATLRYQGGSLATITYTTVGNRNLPKERLEIFRGGGVAVVDDFRVLNLSLPMGVIKTRPERDKGYLHQLTAFLAWVKGGEDLGMPLDEILQTSETTFAIHDAIRGHT
jgi:predicted dehydrogenase/threonine dehydrogenase-like Zn-dependent dehydrogenase